MLSADSRALSGLSSQLPLLAATAAANTTDGIGQEIGSQFQNNKQQDRLREFTHGFPRRNHVPFNRLCIVAGMDGSNHSGKIHILFSQRWGMRYVLASMAARWRKHRDFIGRQRVRVWTRNAKR